jgi:hypothetical protein
MRHVVILVLPAVLMTLSSLPALAASTPAPSAVTSEAQPVSGFPLLPCLGASESLLCVDNPMTYTPHPPTSLAGSTPPLGPEHSGLRNRLESRFDAGFFSRRRRQERCLRATPAKPPQAYRNERAHNGIAHMQANRELPFFDAMQRQQPTQRPIRQDAYSAYFYCVTHDGF